MQNSNLSAANSTSAPRPTASPLLKDTLYRPERLDGESQPSYRHRRRVAKLSAALMMLIPGHKASPAKLMRRKLVDVLGIRQAKKWLRATKAERSGQANLAPAQ